LLSGLKRLVRVSRGIRSDICVHCRSVALYASTSSRMTSGLELDNAVRDSGEVARGEGIDCACQVRASRLLRASTVSAPRPSRGRTLVSGVSACRFLCFFTAMSFVVWKASDGGPFESKYHMTVSTMQEPHPGASIPRSFDVPMRMNIQYTAGSLPRRSQPVAI
jgi:hypothetical protein